MVSGDHALGTGRFKSSGQFNATYAPKNARLNTHVGWIPKNDDANQWIHAEFHDNYRFRRILLQGVRDQDRWVTKFKLQFKQVLSNEWVYYTEPYGTIKVCN